MQQDQSSSFELFVSITRHIRNEFERENEEWLDSPFAWIRELPPASRGMVGKRLVSAWCAANGLLIDAARDSEADVVLNGHRIEIKLSTLWRTGEYRFQQIRDQDYEYVTCLGISPFSAHCWVISKDILRGHVIGHLPQHRGAQGTDTFWFGVIPDIPPGWLSGCGGTLEEAIDILRRLPRK